MDFLALSKIATGAALAAGEIIRAYIDKEVEVESKDGGDSYASQVVTKVDKECEKVILSHLLPSSQEFDIALLSEETDDDGSRFIKDFFWCVDPMDGTLAFINKYPGFAVSIALVSKGGVPQIGVVYDPSTENLYHAISGHGAFKNNSPWSVKYSNTSLSYFTDRPLKDIPQAEVIRAKLTECIEGYNLTGLKEISGAGVVLNAISVVEHGPACMIKAPKKENGGGSLWDYAATACIYEELGLHATNFMGSRLDLNRKKTTFMNHEGIFYANIKRKI